jgi:hypothetical protein
MRLYKEEIDPQISPFGEKGAGVNETVSHLSTTAWQPEKKQNCSGPMVFPSASKTEMTNNA